MLKLPTNFGIHFLHKETNNNMSFIMKNGKKFGASSLMLGIHSPILLKNYIEPGILDVEVEEFAPEVVRNFMEAMYSDKLVVKRDNFREINKICNVFRVDWMVKQCCNCFEDWLAQASINNLLEMIYLFNEALFCIQMLKKEDFKNMILKRHTKSQLQVFLKVYLGQTGVSI